MQLICDNDIVKKYSQIKESLNLNNLKKLHSEQAYVTHCLQNPESEMFKKKALDYLGNGKSQEILLDILNQKIQWDVPFPPIKNPQFSFIDLFAGIGGFRIALQAVQGKCVFSSEINDAAKRTYESNYGEYPFGDIREFTGEDISDKELSSLIPDHDILAGGFPCQPFSLAGVSARTALGQVHGFLDEVKGNLFFDIARIISVKKPRVVFLENVKNFKNHDNGNTFKTVEKTLKDLGYSFYSEVINADRTVPQSRQRFYMVCFRENIDHFEFPRFEGEALTLRSILEENVSENYTISDRLWEGHIKRTMRNLERGTGFTANTANLDKPSKTLVARYGKDGKECLIPQDDANPRKLTPRECARLQGFPENYILPGSNAAAYQQFGNSVAVPVVEAIAKKIIETLNRYDRIQ